MKTRFAETMAVRTEACCFRAGNTGLGEQPQGRPGQFGCWLVSKPLTSFCI